MTHRIDDLAKAAMVELIKQDGAKSPEWLAERSYEIAQAMERVRRRLVQEAALALECPGPPPEDWRVDFQRRINQAGARLAAWQG
jgi:hypothetical protein